MKFPFYISTSLSCLALLFVFNISFSQTNEILIRSELENAKTDIADEQFRSAIRHLDEAKRLLKETTPEIQSLLVKSYVGLEYFDDARKELELYFQIATETSPNYTEMVRLVGKMSDLENRQAMLEAEEKKAKEEEKNLWIQVTMEKSTASVNRYLEKYPDGMHSMTARNYLAMQKEFQAEKSLAGQYKNKWQKRKKTRVGLLVTGLILTGAGAVLAAATSDFTYQDSYYGNNCGCFIYYTDTDYSKMTWNTIGLSATGGGGGLILTAAFINSKKHKKNYYKQLDKLQVLENQLGDALR